MNSRNAFDSMFARLKLLCARAGSAVVSKLESKFLNHRIESREWNFVTKRGRGEKNFTNSLRLFAARSIFQGA
jgi:hypothetical protein